VRVKVGRRRPYLAVADESEVCEWVCGGLTLLMQQHALLSNSSSRRRGGLGTPAPAASPDPFYPHTRAFDRGISPRSIPIQTPPLN
jgi:hypothetical protein